eukprot:CAMPEP_0195297742 /NCGR_PEP_ID=MMETSP0707-20130614/22108_1 /TAXON_ID=33640 /ORGANISM="Asterionellopsis glacialis, Strain CCMP134" /LENGTH=363 /DNA_ID=CAMNT_0040359645 /DNA_START=149 /DNA_END=1236 /DNA_ORIENTATION=-
MNDATNISQNLRRLSFIYDVGGYTDSSDAITSYIQSKNLKDFAPAVGKHERRKAKLVTHPQIELNELPPTDRTGPGDDTVFLIGIFSMIGGEHQQKIRQTIRGTYLSYDSRVCALNDFIQYKDEGLDSKVKDCRVLYTFVFGANNNGPTDHYHSNEPLTVDGAQKVGDLYEKDSTYLNIRENMVEGKSPTWMDYGASIASKYGIDYISKCDSDTVLSMPHLIDYIITDLSPAPYNVRIFGGLFIKNFRRGKPGNIYAAGQFYFVSSDLAYYLSSDEIDRQGIVHSENYKIIGGTAEDFDVSAFIQSHPYPIKYVMMNHRIIWAHSSESGYNLKHPDGFMAYWKSAKGLIPAKRSFFLSKLTCP